MWDWGISPLSLLLFLNVAVKWVVKEGKENTEEVFKLAMSTMQHIIFSLLLVSSSSSPLDLSFLHIYHLLFSLLPLGCLFCYLTKTRRLLLCTVHRSSNHYHTANFIISRWLRNEMFVKKARVETFSGCREITFFFLFLN